MLTLQPNLYDESKYGIVRSFPMSYNTYDLQNILNTILQSHLQSAYPEVGNHSELKVNFNPSTFYIIVYVNK